MLSGNPRVFALLFIFFVSALPAFAQSMKMDSPKSSAQPAAAGRTRTYYIAADDVLWDYVYTGMNGISGQPFQSIGYFANTTPGGKPIEKAVSTAYLKTLYREYTDDTFKTLK